MNGLATLLLVFLLCSPAWAQSPSPKPTKPVMISKEALGPVANYKQPFPHSSGAELLPFCELTDEMVSQIRCDYYVQAIADLVTIKLRGKRLACIPPSYSRTQLMELAVGSLKKTHFSVLEQQSAASLIMQAFARSFPCPVETKAGSFSPQMIAALEKRLEGSKKKKKAPQVDAKLSMNEVLMKRLAAGDIKVGEGGVTAEKFEAIKQRLAAHKQKKAAEAAESSVDCKCPDASKTAEAAAPPASPDAPEASATTATATSTEPAQATAAPQASDDAQ